MATQHTFGDSCLLKEESNTFTRRASSVAIDPPRIIAQYFYCSSLPIDDPLAAIPAPSGTSAVKSSRVPPRPFSVHDNRALDLAWLKLRNTSQPPAETLTSGGACSRKGTVTKEDPSSELYAASIPRKKPGGGNLINESAQDMHEKGSLDESAIDGVSARTQTNNPANNVNARNDTIVAGSQVEHNLGEKPLVTGTVPYNDVGHQPLQETVPVSAEEIIDDQVKSGLPKARRSRSFFHRKEEESSLEDLVSSRSSARQLSRGKQEGDKGAHQMGRSPDTTGTPFLRVPARLRRARSRSPNSGAQKSQVDGAGSPERDYRPKHSSPLGTRPRFPRVSSSEESQNDDYSDPERALEGRRNKARADEAVHVTVGISRLHVVELPSLKVCRPPNLIREVFNCLADTNLRRWDQYIGTLFTTYHQSYGVRGSIKIRCGQSSQSSQIDSKKATST